MVGIGVLERRTTYSAQNKTVPVVGCVGQSQRAVARTRRRMCVCLPCGVLWCRSWITPWPWANSLGTVFGLAASLSIEGLRSLV